MDVAGILPFQRMSGLESNPFLWKALDLIGCTTILGVSYGIAFILYCLCAQPLYSQLQKPDQRPQARFTLTYISLLLFQAIGLLALNARMIQLAYINHADFPGWPMAFEDDFNSTTGPLILTGGILDLCIEVLTTVIQVCHRP